MLLTPSNFYTVALFDSLQEFFDNFAVCSITAGDESRSRPKKARLHNSSMSTGTSGCLRCPTPPGLEYPPPPALDSGYTSRVSWQPAESIVMSNCVISSVQGGGVISSGTGTVRYAGIRFVCGIDST